MKCETCHTAIESSDYKDRRNPRTKKDSSVTIVVNRALCIPCMVGFLSQVVTDYHGCQGDSLRGEGWIK